MRPNTLSNNQEQISAKRVLLDKNLLLRDPFRLIMFYCYMNEFSREQNLGRFFRVCFKRTLKAPSEDL
jgi:hypothetical protein